MSIKLLKLISFEAILIEELMFFVEIESFLNHFPSTSNLERERKRESVIILQKERKKRKQLLHDHMIT